MIGVVQEQPAPADRLVRDRAHWWWIVGVFALALLVRTVHFTVTFHRDPFLRAPVVDASLHDVWARQLNGLATPASPALLDGQAYYKPPLYPYLLAAAYKVVGVDYPLVRALQLLAGAATCGLIALLGIRVAGDRVGAIAGAMAAFYGPLIHEEGQLLSTGLEVLLCVLFMLAMLKAAEVGLTRYWFLAGAVLSLATIARPTLLPAGLAAAAWLWWMRYRAGQSQGWQATLVFLAGCALFVIPVTARNWLVGGEIVPVSANGGINFFTGNHLGADGYSAIPEGAKWERYQQEAHNAGALKPGEASRYWTARGWQELRAMSAGEIAGLYWRKLTALFTWWEIRNNVGYDFARRFSVVLLPARLAFGLLFPLAVLGVIVGRKQNALAPLIVFASVLLLVLLPFFVCARFRLPAVPFLMILAAVGVEWLWLDGVQQIRLGHRPAILAIGVTAFAAALCHADLSGARQSDTGARDYYLQGLALSRRGDLAGAIESLKRSIALSPEDPDPLFHLGLLSERQGHLAAAETAYRAAAELEPTFFDALSNLGSVLINQRRPSEAEEVLLQAVAAFPDSARGWHNLSIAYALQDKNAQALDAARKAAKLDPSNVQPLLLQSDVLVKDKSRAAEAEKLARKALAMAPALPGCYVALGRALARQGRWQEAAKVLSQAPATPDVVYLLGTALEMTGRPEDARAAYTRLVDAAGETTAGKLAAKRLEALGD
ncbi:MAG: tetratricopeptide repeat protein [Armatimonadetes bacterium]|nr:tetratricopeptide repeat protein [Armatimonadota bacterium]